MSSTITYKGSTLTIVNNTTRTLLTSGKWMEADIVITDVTSGGSVTITDEANATGTTCVITTGQTPTPTPSGDIPLNTQLIDFAKVKSQYIVDGDTGEEVSAEWGCSSDYTVIDPTMTFTYIGYQWWDSAFYDSSKTYISGFHNDAYADSIDTETGITHGTLTPSIIPSNAMYIRIDAVNRPDNSELSLIRIA